MHWKNFITANPAAQKTVYNVTDSGSKDVLLRRFVDTVDVSNEDTLNVDTETIVAQLIPAYVEISMGGTLQTKKSDFMSGCTRRGLEGVQEQVELIPSFFGTFRFNAGWRRLKDSEKPLHLVTNQIESITVPAGTFSARHLKFQKEETNKGIQVNKVYQMWLSGIGVAERIIKFSEHVELLNGEQISWDLTELAFCGWQQASDL